MTDRHFCLDDSPWFQMLELDEVTSTNDFLRGYRPLGGERKLTLVTAEFQTAGRGAGTNRWESERSQNLVFSMLTHPRHIRVEEVFVLSEVLALSIRDAVADFVNEEVKIKWPNDIYCGDRKVCGMLLENDLRSGHIENCVMGVGININQTLFRSDAPNPVSLAQILGHTVEPRFVLERLVENFVHLYELTEQGQRDHLHQLYLSHLYRWGQRHQFVDDNGRFWATILDVKPTGHLMLIDDDGATREYAFKEVEHII